MTFRLCSAASGERPTKGQSTQFTLPLPFTTQPYKCPCRSKVSLHVSEWTPSYVRGPLVAAPAFSPAKIYNKIGTPKLNGSQTLNFRSEADGRRCEVSLKPRGASRCGLLDSLASRSSVTDTLAPIHSVVDLEESQL